MTNKITVKRSSVTGKVPEPGDLDYGEFALNYTDGNLFFKSNANVITNLASTKFVSVTGNVQGGNVVSLGAVSATGNVAGNYFIGNGSQLTGITAAGGTTTFSSSPPSSPSQGDVWIDADTGTQYIYFNDGSSSQWAEMQAAVSISTGSASAPSGGQPSNVYFLQGTTTDNTETELFVNGESNNRIAVPLDTSVYYTVEIACKRTNGTDFAAFSLKSMANNSSNTVTDVGSVYEIVVVRTDASIAVDVRADDTNNSIGVFVTGVTGKSLSWTAQVTVIEV
jgi:hypothetical protein